MSEKVLGFYEKKAWKMKLSSGWHIPKEDLVCVRLASESVDLKKLEEWLKEARNKMPDEHDKAIVSQVTGFILGKDLAEKEAKK